MHLSILDCSESRVLYGHAHIRMKQYLWHLLRQIQSLIVNTKYPFTEFTFCLTIVNDFFAPIF